MYCWACNTCRCNMCNSRGTKGKTMWEKHLNISLNFQFKSEVESKLRCISPRATIKKAT